MRKLVFVIEHLRGGGAERVTAALMKANGISVYTEEHSDALFCEK